MVSRRSAVALLLAGLLPSLATAQPAFQPTPRDRADLARVEAYLNGIRTLKAQFLQVAPDGGISRGTVWLQRPGHLRFQYDPPAPFLLVASHGLLVFHDSALRQTSNIPLGRTPLGILLAEQVSLSGDVTVSNVQRSPGQVQISLFRTASPGDGLLVLTFADDPLALRQWTVIDAQRRETRVTLYNIELGGRFDPKLFEFAEPLRPPVSSGGG
jgi:outer membrane lipoprotein-sorting protein